MKIKCLLHLNESNENFSYEKLTDKLSYLAAVAANVLSTDSRLAESLAIRSRFSPVTDTRAIMTENEDIFKDHLDKYNAYQMSQGLRDFFLIFWIIFVLKYYK